MKKKSQNNLRIFLIIILLLVSTYFIFPGVCNRNYVHPALSGKIVDAETGEPVSGAIIYYSSNLSRINPDIIPYNCYGRSYFEKTDEDGKFSIPESKTNYLRGCRLDPVKVKIFKPDYYLYSSGVSTSNNTIKLKPADKQFNPCNDWEYMESSFLVILGYNISAGKENVTVAMEIQKEISEYKSTIKGHPCTQVKKLIKNIKRGKQNDISFIKEHPEVINMADDQGITPLLHAAMNGDLETTKLLVEMGADMNSTAYSGDSALHLASEKGHLEIVKFLIENGMDIEIKDEIGRTPLFSGIHGKQSEIAFYLISKGASYDIQDEQGFSVLHLAIWRKETGVINYLLGKNVEVNTKTEHLKETPLMRAVLEQDKEIIEQLLSHGANIDARDNKGMTVFELTNDEAILKILKKYKNQENK